MNGYFKKALRHSMLGVMGMDGAFWKHASCLPSYCLLTATVMNTNFRQITVMYMCAPSENEKYIRIAVDRVIQEYPWLVSGEAEFTLLLVSDRGTAIRVILSSVSNAVHKFCFYHLLQ